MIKFGYTIAYVADVEVALRFFEKAFDLKRRFKHATGTYAELETGPTILAFASHDLGAMNLPDGYVQASSSPKPLGIEVALVTEDVHKTHQHAIQRGANELKAPEAMPWDQTVSYLRCPSGILIELCTPMSNQA